MGQSPISNVDAANYRQAFTFSKIAQYDHGDALWYFVKGHVESMTFIDILIEEVSDVHSPDVTEEALNSESLLVLYDSKKVQLEKFDYHFYPLELISFKLDRLTSLNHVFATGAAGLSLMVLIL